MSLKIEQLKGQFSCTLLLRFNSPFSQSLLLVLAPEVIDGISSGPGPGRLPRIRGCITAERSRGQTRQGSDLLVETMPEQPKTNSTHP